MKNLLKLKITFVVVFLLLANIVFVSCGNTFEKNTGTSEGTQTSNLPIADTIFTENSEVSSSEPSEGSVSESAEDSKSDFAETTCEPEVTTKEPEVTTKEPEVTTKEPEVTTKEPEVTTKEPEVTTKEPEVTTKEPEVTTKEPEVTTKEPEVTTKEPEVTTKGPEVTTKEPEVTTKEPEVTTDTQPPQPPVHIHLYSSYVYQPSCSEKGYTEYVCDCGDKYRDNYVDKLPHVIEIRAQVPPTCTLAGVRDLYCKNCSYSDVEVIPATNHSMGDWFVSVVPTTEKNGTEKRKCLNSGCIYFETREIPKIEAPAADFTVLKGNALFGYQALYDMPNAENLKLLYKEMEEKCYELYSSLTDIPNTSDAYVFAKIDYSKYSLSTEEARIVKQIFDLDHPRYYWLSGSYSYNSKEIYLCVYEEYARGTERAKYNAKIEDYLNEISALASAYTRTFEKVYAVHKSLVLRIDYKYMMDGITPSSEISAHNIIGAVTRAGGVCECYSKTLQMLLNYIGIDCINVIGTDAGGGSHAWNIVRLDDGKWYNIDATWNDAKGAINYRYFGTKNSTFSTDHIAYKNTGSTPQRYMFKTESPQDDVTLTPILLYENNNLLGYYGTFDDAIDAMRVGSANYRIELLDCSTEYILACDIPRVESVTIKGIVEFASNDSFYRSSLSLGANVTLNTDLTLECLGLDSETGKVYTLNIGGNKLTVAGYYTQLKAGLRIKGDKGSEFVPLAVNRGGQRDTYMTVLFADIDVDRLTISDNNQVHFYNSNNKFTTVSVGKTSMLVIGDTNPVNMDIGSVLTASGQSYIYYSANVAHIVKIGNVTGTTTDGLVIRIRLSSLNISASLSVSGNSSVPLLVCFECNGCDIYNCTDALMKAQNMNNIYFFVNGQQDFGRFILVNGEIRIKQ